MAVKVYFSIDPDLLKRHWAEKFNESIPESKVSETESFRQEVESKWLQCQDSIIQNVERITGLVVSGEFHVAVLHPVLDEAQYIDASHIEWGHREAQQNGISIGLAHEIIHCITHEFYSQLSDDEKWIFHSLVYLSADEELRFVLNGKSEYFDSPIIQTYHERLILTAKKLLPLWKKYMATDSGENIISFFKKHQSELYALGSTDKKYSVRCANSSNLGSKAL